jgi:hypothetical protein
MYYNKTFVNILLAIMLWLSFRYVLKIQQIDKETIEITTWSIVGYKKVYIERLDILQNIKFHLGQSSFANAPSVNAPYYTLKTSKGKTLILDLKAEFNF